MPTELTNAEFAVHMRFVADVLDSHDNAWNKILPAILRTLRKGAGIIEALTAENAAKNEELFAYKKHGLEPCDYAIVRHAMDEEKRCKQELNEAVKLIARMIAEKDAAVATIDEINNIAVEAIEYGPYQDGEEATIFCRIEELSRRGPKEDG